MNLHLFEVVLLIHADETLQETGYNRVRGIQKNKDVPVGKGTV